MTALTTVSLTRAEYIGITPDPNTLYIVSDGSVQTAYLGATVLTAGELAAAKTQSLLQLAQASQAGAASSAATAQLTLSSVNTVGGQIATNVAAATTAASNAAASATAASGSASAASSSAATAASQAAAAETAKNDAVTAKSQTISAKDDAVTAKNQAVSAKEDAVSAKTSAQTASADAVNAKNLAVSAKDDAVSAKTDAITAKEDAVSAKAQAVTAKEDAVTAKTQAVSAKDDAVTAKTQAASSATTCIDKAAEASQSATNASSSATSAQASATASALSATEAEASHQETLALSMICPPACTGLGIVRGESSVSVTWSDPDDMTINGWGVAEIQRTLLVGKVGAIPTSRTDGTIYLATSRTPATDTYPLPAGVSYALLNAYSLEQATVQVESADTVYFKLFSCSKGGGWNALPANEFPGYTNYSWPQLADLADAGTFLQHIPLGSAMDAENSDIPGMQWLVVGEDCFNRRDGLQSKHTIALISRYSHFTCQYDAPEATWAQTQDTSAVTGVKYGLLIGTTYTALTEGTDWNPGDTSCTYGGVTYPISQWYERNPNTSQGNGTNVSSQSNFGQWCDAEGAIGQWYTKKNLWDKNGSVLAGKAGFLHGLPATFRAFMVDAVRTCYLYTAYRLRGRTSPENYYARAFALTLFEINGTTNGGVQEGRKKMDFFTTNDSRICYESNGTTKTTWWSASAVTYNAYDVSFVTTAGSTTSHYANNACGARPACAFGKRVDAVSNAPEAQSAG